jgi:hypothetical protein
MGGKHRTNVETALRDKTDGDSENSTVKGVFYLIN